MERNEHQHEGSVVKLLYTIEEAAEALSIGRTVLYELVMRRQIRSIKIGKARRIPTNSLTAFIEQQQDY